MRIKRATTVILAMAFLASLYSSITNTWKWASDFNGLVILVSMPNAERSFNPFSKDFFWLSQDMAISIIKNFEYPYERCSSISKGLGGCEQPRIEYSGRMVGMVDPETELKMFEIVRFLIERGEPVDAYSSEGFTALQSAILGNRSKLVTVLLKAGANPYLPINHEGKLKGKNSVEFVEWLSSKNETQFSALRESFYKNLPNKPARNLPVTPS